MAVIGVLLVAVPVLWFLRAVASAVLLGGHGVGGQPVVVVGHSRAREPTEQQGARDQEQAEVSEAVQECGDQGVLTRSFLPTNALGVPAGRCAIKICAVGRLGSLAIACLAIAAVGACGPFCRSGKVALTNARVDSTFTCPNPSTNRPYDVHGSLDVDNGTGNTVTIKSVTEADELVDVHGGWNIGDVGTKSQDPVDTFSPKSVKAGDKTTIKFVIKFTCTDNGVVVGKTYGDFTFKFTVDTSAGTLNITSANKHRLVVS